MTPTGEQEQIIHHHGSHSKIIAVAGSGKTHTMVLHALHAIESGCKPECMLAVMFNVAAQKDYLRRLESLLTSQGLTTPNVRTFNAMGNRLCKRFEKQGHLPVCQLQTQSSIYSALCRDALKLALNDFPQIDLTPYDLAEEFEVMVERVKSDILAPEIIAENMSVKPALTRLFVTAFEHFESLRLKRRWRFYNDQVWEPTKLMLDNPTLANSVSNRLSLIIVDEGQDLNPIQASLVRIVAGDTARIALVGDVDQTIYAWRGANPKYLLSEFENTFQPTTTYTLSRTFRYGHRLSLMANHLIRNNKEREDTFCVSYPGRPDTQVSVVWEKPGPHPALEVIEQWLANGHKLDDLAILVRQNSFATGIILELLANQIPFHLEGAMRFLVKENYVDALVAVLEACAGTLLQPGKENRIANLLSFPLVAVNYHAWLRLAKEAIEQQSYTPILNGIGQLVKNDYAQQRTIERMLWVTQVAGTTYDNLLKAGKDHGQAVHQILHKYTQDVADYPGALARISPTVEIEESKRMVVKDVIAFMARQNLSAADTAVHIDILANQVKNSQHGVTLSTIHGAKGLEYDGIIITGLNDHQFPSRQSPIEEERRLFYVGITRAKHALYLVSPDDPDLKKQLNGEPITHNGKTLASRFLYECNIHLSDQVASLIEDNTLAKITEAKPVPDASVVNRYLKEILPANRILEMAEAPPVTSTSIGSIRAGQLPRKIKHSRYGLGKVTDWGDQNLLMYVVFDAHEGWFRVQDTPFEIVK